MEKTISKKTDSHVDQSVEKKPEDGLRSAIHACGGPEAYVKKIANQYIEDPELGELLDYSLDSLNAVDSALDGAKDTDGLAVPLGCYVGEVLIKHIGGRWVLREDPTEMMGPLVIEAPRIVIGPIERCVKRIRNGETDSVDFWGRCIVAMAKQDQEGSEALEI